MNPHPFSYGVFGGGDRVGGGYLELEVLILVFGLVNWEETSNHKKFEFVGIESVRVERENLLREQHRTQSNISINQKNHK